MSELAAVNSSIEEAPLTALLAAAIPIPDPSPQLNERDRFTSFISSNVARHRLLYSRRLAEVACTDIDLVIACLQSLMTDSEHLVRLSMTQELGQIYRQSVLQNCAPSALYSIVAALKSSLTDGAVDLRQAGISSVVNMCPLLAPCRMQSDLMPLAALMLDMGMADEIRADGVLLLLKLYSWLREPARDRIKEMAAYWATDPSFRVRKAVTRHLNVLGPSSLPVSDGLSRDMIWGVRRASAQGLLDMLAVVEDPNLRRDVLIPQIKRACSDQSRWVRNDAFQALGGFIFALELNQVDSELLDLFTALPTLSCDAGDDDPHYTCAFNFPAVVSRLGRGQWSQLLPTYSLLCKNPKFKVRRTLAFSLSSMARILGPEITDRDLLTTFEMFSKDLEEVRQGIIGTLAEMLEAMSPAVRITYTDTLWDIQRETQNNWRHRASLASQLSALSRLFPPDIICTRLLPLALALVHDRVAYVRQVAVTAMGPLMMLVRDSSPDAFSEFIYECLLLATADTCQDRQLFLLLCQSLLYTVPTKMFCDWFLIPFTSLANDRVINVRRQLSRILFELPGESPFRAESSILVAMGELRSLELSPAAARLGSAPKHRLTLTSPATATAIGLQELSIRVERDGVEDSLNDVIKPDGGHDDHKEPFRIQA
uniref:Condensin complex subunit 1 C-terminal domain-containing protein n=1 Tax=Spongospora subterranea TaxID=70186 RepID=A0A0H5R9W7_9EUKA|eukprot:CRZ10930.1 hypothetical protein [Spongospora subterranea]